MKGSGLALAPGFISTSVRLGRLRTGFGSLGLILRSLGVTLGRLGFGLGLRIRVSLGLNLRFSRGPLHRIARFRQVLSLDLGRFDFPASRLNGSACTLRGANALERHRLLDLARENDLGVLGKHRNDARLLQGLEVNDVALDLIELMQAHFGARHGPGGGEAELRQTPVERSLTTLESDLVIATLASALSLDATAAGFALASGCPTPHAQARTLRSMAGFQCIQSHIVGPKLRAALTPGFPLSTGAQPRGSSRDYRECRPLCRIGEA